MVVIIGAYDVLADGVRKSDVACQDLAERPARENHVSTPLRGLSFGAVHDDVLDVWELQLLVELVEPLDPVGLQVGGGDDRNLGHENPPGFPLSCAQFPLVRPNSVAGQGL